MTDIKNINEEKSVSNDTENKSHVPNKAEELKYSSNVLYDPPAYKKTLDFIWEIIKIAAVSLAIIIPIRMYVVQPFIVEGASMLPNFSDGQYLIIDEISYRFAPPKRGDVVIFHPPGDNKTFYIKRIIGLPGETVELREGNIYVTNSENSDGFRLNEINYLSKSHVTQIGKTVLGEGEYYLLGDNRENSLDSRRFGPVNADQIKGRVLIRAFPFNEFSVFEEQRY